MALASPRIPSAAAIQRGAAHARIRILLIEDMAATAEIVKGYLAAVAPAATVEWAATLSAALQLLAVGAFDLVLADLNLPDSDGLNTLDRLLEATDRLVVVLTSEEEQVFRDAALERGAYDFLHKSRLNRQALGQIVRLATIQADTFRSLRENQHRIERLSRVHAMLSGINALIVRARGRDEVFREACRVAVEAGGFRVAWIGLLERETMRVQLAAWQGPGRELVENVVMDVGEGAPGGGSALALAIRDGRAAISNDIEHDARIALRGEMAAYQLRSMAVLPLLVAGEAVGALTLVSGEAGFFDDEEVRLLSDLAGDISFALDHIEKEKKLAYLALYDSLTGLANRSLFLERLNRSLHAAAQSGGKFPIALVDIERFRTVNESLGRQAGDALLAQAAGRLARAAGRTEVARTGPDQFAMVLAAAKGRSQAARMVQALRRECFSEPFALGGSELRTSVKAGIALYPNDGADAETLLKHAEAALRRSKDTGEPFVFYTPALTARSAATLTLENKLRQALKNGEFVLHYQPKVDIETRRVIGVEALIRWQSPELGLVPPMQFIPLMEETGMILEAGAWALRQAVADHCRWAALGLAAPRVAVNVSPIQLRKKDFVATIVEAIGRGPAASGLSSCLDLELTESLIMEDIEGNIRKLKEVRALGVGSAIDDFGTGYSSLAYLARLPVQTLKIDRSFVMTMLNDSAAMTLVQMIISLARSLKLTVVAEGVDAESQAKMLRLLRCDEMQGYLFSKPLPFEEMTALLGQERRV